MVTFKFNTVKFAILELRKHKRMTNTENYIINENGSTSLFSRICLTENDQGVLLNYSVLPRTEFARVWPANGTLHRLLLVESLGLCEKDFSGEAIS